MKTWMSSRAPRLWVKSVKLTLLTRDNFTKLDNVKDLKKLEHVSNVLLNIALECAPGLLSLRA
jgi:hypothetical protein